jgi:hypothetical protein
MPPPAGEWQTLAVRTEDNPAEGKDAAVHGYKASYAGIARGTSGPRGQRRPRRAGYRKLQGRDYPSGSILGFKTGNPKKQDLLMGWLVEPIQNELFTATGTALGSMPISNAKAGSSQVDIQRFTMEIFYAASVAAASGAVSAAMAK